MRLRQQRRHQRKRSDGSCDAPQFEHFGGRLQQRTPNGRERRQVWFERHGHIWGGWCSCHDGRAACGGSDERSGLATFAIAKDPRLTTTVHISGGTMPSHEAVANLHAPAAFICGEDTGDGNILGPGDIATPNCKIDFMSSKVPTFFAEGKGLSHATGYNMMQPPVVAWMRWLLAGDTTMRDNFVGPNCGFCKAPWVAMQKDLDKIP